MEKAKTNLGGGKTSLVNLQKQREEKLDYFLRLCQLVGMTREEITDMVSKRLNEQMND